MPYVSLLTAHVAWTPPDAERDRPVLGAITGERRSLIVDTGASPAHARQLRNGLVELGAAEPGFAALTHYHWDHVFGGSALNVPIIAHVETRQRVQEMARLDWRDNALAARVAAGQEKAAYVENIKREMNNAERAALVIVAPEVVYSDGVEIDLGGLTARILHIGGDHTPDSSIIYCPEERVAFLGDCFYTGTRAGLSCYTTAGLFPLLDRLEALPVDYYVLGHDPDPWPREKFLHEAGNLRRTGELVAKTGPDREALVAQLPAALLAPVEDYHYEDLDAFLNGLNTRSG
jgi:glyoxylase-like metal-dependent hydrolase (beta-lactamase superfamily II)